MPRPLLPTLAAAWTLACAPDGHPPDARCDAADATTDARSDRGAVTDATPDRGELAVGLPVVDAPPPLLDAGATSDARADASWADLRAPTACERCTPPGLAFCDGSLVRVCADASPWPCWREFDCASLRAACSPYRPDAGAAASPPDYCLNACGGRGRALTHPLDAPVEGLPCARYVCDVERGDTRPSHAACRRVGEPCEAPAHCESLRCERGQCLPR